MGKEETAPIVLESMSVTKWKETRLAVLPRQGLATEMQAPRAVRIRVPCASHPCSPLYPASPAVPRKVADAPCPLHDVPGSEDDDHDHDPLYFDPRQRPQQRKPDERALAKNSEFQKQYDSHARERQLREQGILDHDVSANLYKLPRGHPVLLPKPEATARSMQPATAVKPAPTHKDTAAPSVRNLPPTASRQPKPLQALPIAAGPSVPRTAHKGRQEPAPTPVARKVEAKVRAAPPTPAAPSASAPSMRGVRAEERARRQSAPPVVSTRARTDAAVPGMRQRLLDSDSTLSDVSPPKKKRKKERGKKKKKKHRRDDNVIIVSTPSGPFSPGTRDVLKSRKALKKAQEMWHVTQYAGACCLIFDICFTLLVLAAVMYWLWPRGGGEEKPKQSGYSDSPDQYIAPALSMNLFSGRIAENVTAFLR